jgi:YVTN family beta-propeller protein
MPRTKIAALLAGTAAWLVVVPDAERPLTVSVAPTLAEGGSPAADPGIIRTRPGAPRLRVVARAPTGSQPKSVVVSPDGTLVYVCNFGRPDRENVTIHDARTLARVGVIEFPGNAVEAAFSPDGRTLFVSNFRRHVVEVIDVATRRVTAEISVGQHPKTIAVSPDGRLIYVANWAGQSVSVVDVGRRVELRRLRTGVHPRGMAVLPDGHLLVASFEGHSVQVFDAGGNREIRRFPTCEFPRHLALGPDSNQLFVTCTLGSIGTYDITTGERRGLASVGRNPRTLGVSRSGRWAATANFGLGAGRPGSVSLVDLVENTDQTTIIPRADRIVGLSIGPGTDLRIYVTSWTTSEVIALAI